jgi:hypothetical protein
MRRARRGVSLLKRLRYEIEINLIESFHYLEVIALSQIISIICGARVAVAASVQSQTLRRV